MKFTLIALISIIGSTVANPIIQEDAPIFADGPIAVSVVCTGNIVWSKLTLLELTTASKVLVESYNAIHALVNNDDSQLRDLTFNGHVKTAMRQEEGEQDTEEDDNDLDAWFQPRPAKGVWTGTWGCSECPDDDSPDVSGPVLKAWQNKFVAGLLESKLLVFQAIRACYIDMEPGEDTWMVDTPNADIEIDCGKHFDMSVLSVSMGAFLSHALQDAYNKVHAENANDDSALTNVYYFKKNRKNQLTSSSSSDETTVGAGGRFHYGPHNPYRSFHSKGVAAPGLSGWWGCRLCPSDDDVRLSDGSNNSWNGTLAMQHHANQLAAATSGPLLQAWEAELNVALQSGPFDVFKKIQWCDLKLVPHKKFFLDEVANDVVVAVAVDDRGCGLRGGCQGDDIPME